MRLKWLSEPDYGKSRNIITVAGFYLLGNAVTLGREAKWTDDTEHFVSCIAEELKAWRPGSNYFA